MHRLRILILSWIGMGLMLFNLAGQSNPGANFWGSETAVAATGNLHVYLPLIIRSGGVIVTGNSDIAQQINIPHFAGSVPFEQSAVFWFGQVDLDKDSADVRIGYTDQEITVNITVIDRRLWYSTSPSPANLTTYDGISLYLSLHGNDGSAPGAKDFRLDSQMSGYEARGNYQAAFQGNGSSWGTASTPFSSSPGWRGTLNQDVDGKGWAITYHIPFSSLGLSSAPSSGAQWALGVVLHDRDSLAGPAQPDESWPKGFDGTKPSTWGGLNFGLPTYIPGKATQSGTVLIRSGFNGAVVDDAAVGGGVNCGIGLDYWRNWGLANYSGKSVTERNIQNQSDISDYPCFSKTYIRFPLSQVPAGKIILSAKLSLYQMGSSDPTQAKSSLIQISRVSPDWNKSTINWNNAPQALENVSQTWVDKLVFPGWQNLPQKEWDVTRAVAMAYAAGQPLSLAFYSADSDYHSGKYFVSSDTDDWNGANRPALNITWGQP
jgi:hypothetical protein